MFSRNLLIIVGLALFAALTFTALTMSTRESLSSSGAQRITITLISPIQHAFSGTANYIQNIWNTYFLAVLAVEENAHLKAELSRSTEIRNRNEELTLENKRLKKFVEFTHQVPGKYIAAQIIARDPSPWFKTVMIDKGSKDGLVKGSPVVVFEGIVGQVIKVAPSYSSVLLIIDQNSAVDALIQNSRVRGIVKGTNDDKCSFVYTLRKEQVNEGEILISSGLDQVYPKGLKIGRIFKVKKLHSQLFQDIVIETFVDFDKIEEVLVFCKTSSIPATDVF